jgi:hypothetical protein
MKEVGTLAVRVTLAAPFCVYVKGVALVCANWKCSWVSVAVMNAVTFAT